MIPYETGQLVVFLESATVWDPKIKKRVSLAGKFGIVIGNASTSNQSGKRFKKWNIYVQELCEYHIFERGEFKKVQNVEFEENKMNTSTDQLGEFDT